jgi:hypothetical protein
VIQGEQRRQDESGAASKRPENSVAQMINKKTFVEYNQKETYVESVVTRSLKEAHTWRSSDGMRDVVMRQAD